MINNRWFIGIKGGRFELTALSDVDIPSYGRVKVGV